MCCRPLVHSPQARARMKFTIAAYSVDFPNSPYGVQLKYMEQVLKALDAGGNALLEAPTGSGKTLALLCSALAWQSAKRRESYKAIAQDMFGGLHPDDGSRNRTGSNAPARKPFQIYYATRSHSQIAQVRCRFAACTESEPGNWKEASVCNRLLLVNTNPVGLYLKVVNELKRTSYRPKTAILVSGNREWHCESTQLDTSDSTILVSATPQFSV